MNDQLEDKLGMYIKVDTFATNNAAALAANAQIEATRVVVHDNILNIIQLESIATRDLSGFGEAKGDAAQLLINRVLLVRGASTGYFTANPDKGKKRIVEFPTGDIQKLRDKDLLSLADQVHDIADPVKATLTAFGCTAAQVDSLVTLSTAYLTISELPRSEQGLSKAAGNERDRVFGKTDDVLTDGMDDYLIVFEQTNAQLYDQYQTARMIDDSGGGSGTDGFTVQNYELPPGVAVPFGPIPTPVDREVYMRQLGGTVGVLVCTKPLETEACTSGFILTPSETVKQPWSAFGLTDNAWVIFTNPGAESVTVRAGLRDV